MIDKSPERQDGCVSSACDQVNWQTLTDLLCVDQFSRHH